MRLSEKQIEQVKRKYNVDELWSFSRLNTYKTSKYEYFLKYIKNEKPLSTVKSVYGIMGGVAHDIIEKYYEGNIKREDMLDEYINEWSLNVDLCGLRFNKEDDEKNKATADKYYKNMCHYFKNFQPINKDQQGDMDNERYILVKIKDDILLQGYVDNYFKYIDENENEHCIVTDWKSSSKYSKKDMKNKSTQLILYAAGLNQLNNVTEYIECRFGFLKYVDITFTQINGAQKVMTVERRQIGEKIAPKVKLWLKKLHPEMLDELDNIIDVIIEDNGDNLDRLPNDVRDKFSITDCFVYIDKPLEKFKELQEDIIKTVEDIRIRTEKWEETNDEKIWWDDEDTCKNESFYFVNLCDYSIDQLLPYKEYLNKLEEESDPAIFSKNKSVEDDDMSWLNLL